MPTPYELLFRTNVQGAADLNVLNRALQAIRESGKASAFAVLDFEEKVRKSVDSGKSLRQALGDIATKSKEFGPEIARSANIALRELNRIEAEARRTARSIEESQKQGVKAIGDAFSNLASNDPAGVFTKIGEAATSGIGKASIGITALVAGFAAATTAATRFVDSQGNLAEETINLAERTGLTISQVERLRAAGDIAGVSIHALESSARFLANALEDGTGAGKRSAVALRELGVSAFTSTGQVRDIGQVTLEALQKLSQIPDTAKRIELANQLLGRGSKELLPLIRDYQALNEAVKELGVGMDENGTRRLAAANDEVDKLRVAFGLLRKELATKIAPVIITIIRDIRNVVEAPGKAVDAASKIAGATKEALTNPFAAITFSGGIQTQTPQEAASEEKASQERIALRQKLAAEELKKIEQTEEGRRTKIAELRKKIADENAKLTSGDLDPEPLRALAKQRDADQSQLERLENAKKNANQTRHEELAIIDLEKRALEALAKETGGLKGELGKLSVEQQAFIDREKTANDGHALSVVQLDRVNRAFELLKFKAITDDIKKFNAEQEKMAEILGLANEHILDQGKDLEKVQKQATPDIQRALFLLTPKTPEFTTPADQDIARVQALQQARVRATQLGGKPGDELGTIQREYSLRLQGEQELHRLRVADIKERLDADKQQAEINKENERFALENDKIRYDRELSILQLQRDRANELRDTYGRIFDALESRGATGLQDLAKGFVSGIGRQIFVNVATELSSGLVGKLQLPGQGTAENPTFLGRVLRGTPLGLDPAKLATDANTAATVANTTAILSMTGAVGGGALTGGSTLGPLFSGSQGGGIFNLLSGGGTVGGQAGFNDPGAIAAGHSAVDAVLGGSTASAASSGIFSKSNLGKGLGIGAAAAGGIYGAVSGFSQGGASGALSGTGSLAGAAGTILALSGVGGPAAPIIAGVGLALQMFSGLFGQNKQQRDADITKMLENNKYLPNTSLDLGFDSGTAGNLFDYGDNGRIRTSEFSNFPVNVREPARYQFDGAYVDVPGQQLAPSDSRSRSSPPPTNVTVQVQTLDSKSFVDNWQMVGEAMRIAAGNHQPLQDELRRQTVNR